MTERGSTRHGPGPGQLLWEATRWVARGVRGEVVKRVGGPARARVVTLFALVLALSGADSSTVGAVAPQLEAGLHIHTAGIGLLASVGLLVGAVFTIPVGLLVDRTKRMPLLASSIVLWSIASLLGAFAGSFSSLLLTRVLLGGVAATAGPAIASLTGDYFPAAERGRIWSYILGGEVAGSAVGFIVSGSVASLIGWRAAFVVLAIPGVFLARELWRTVPEPLRGGQSYLEPGMIDLDLALAAARARADRRSDWFAEEEDRAAAEQAEGAHAAARRAGAVPNPALVLREDPRRMPLVRAVRYILAVPSNLMMIVGSSLGYFYFAGLTTFALLFVKGHYQASQAEAELVLALLVIASIVGTLAGGRVTDLMLRRGSLKARVWVPGACYIGAALFLIPGFVETDLGSALWLVMPGAALLAAANPPVQAARLDIMPAGLWGRAESTRTVIRSLIQALAPLVFGGLAQLIAGFFPSQSPIGTHPSAPSGATTHGLQISFLVLLATLVAAGILLIRARVTYAADVATAAASEEWIRAASGRPPPAGAGAVSAPVSRTPRPRARPV
jgi:MFS family permease